VLAEVILSGLTQTYDGSEKVATVTTDPAGLSVVVTYDGASTKPVTVGDYAVVATVSDGNYKGSTSGTLTIAKGSESGEGNEGAPVTAEVSLTGLSHTYDGSAKLATVTTNPAGLNVVVTYTDLDDGSAVTSPTEVGEYAVVATVDDGNYKGSSPPLASSIDSVPPADPL
jgi:hypothetical protein